MHASDLSALTSNLNHISAGRRISGGFLSGQSGKHGRFSFKMTRLLVGLPTPIGLLHNVTCYSVMYTEPASAHQHYYQSHTLLPHLSKTLGMLTMK